MSSMTPLAVKGLKAPLGPFCKISGEVDLPNKDYYHYYYYYYCYRYLQYYVLCMNMKLLVCFA